MAVDICVTTQYHFSVAKPSCSFGYSFIVFTSSGDQQITMARMAEL